MWIAITMRDMVGDIVNVIFSGLVKDVVLSCERLRV